MENVECNDSIVPNYFLDQSIPMASSSSSNKLQNSYFFYGTHPLKVPNILVHANSTTSLATPSSTDANSTHLSLNLTNTEHYYHGYSSTADLPTAKSLQNLIESRSHDDDNNEVRTIKLYLSLSHT